MNIDRNKLIEEQRLREYIKRAIKVVKKKMIAEEIKSKKEETKLREYIVKLVEADSNVAAPHESTGINVLEDLLKKIIPQLEIEYKKLTTDPEQRSSFRSHILNAIQNSLAPTKISDKAGSEEEAGKAIDIGLEESISEADVEMEVGEEEGLTNQEEFIDIDGDNAPEEETEEEKFGIQGEDETGRNIAFSSFERIEQAIVDSYSLLSNDNDRELFYDYLITNIKLYFDKFEDELLRTLPEPTTPEYEAEKDSQLDAPEEPMEEPEDLEI